MIIYRCFQAWRWSCQISLCGGFYPWITGKVFDFVNSYVFPSPVWLWLFASPPHLEKSMRTCAHGPLSSSISSNMSPEVQGSPALTHNHNNTPEQPPVLYTHSILSLPFGETFTVHSTGSKLCCISAGSPKSKISGQASQGTRRWPLPKKPPLK